MSDGVWSPAGTDGTYQYSATTLSVYWPQDEFRVLITQWPHVAAHVGTTSDEHQKRVERHFARVEQAGHKQCCRPNGLGTLD
jgi:hypothetical protein